MKTSILNFILIGLLAISCKNEPKKAVQEITPAVSNNQEKPTETNVKIVPINHASMILELNGKTIYVDPVGGSEPYKNNPAADIVLVTDIHGDHLDPLTLEKITSKDTKIIAPKAVETKLNDSLQIKTTVLDNGETTKINNIKITAVPMYNLREEAKKFHVKGRGNGYILAIGETKIYISGDTGPIPEMRTLENIDIAFVCMNLPYTMPVGAAADAVLDFAPAKVYPYHYRGKNGLSNVAEFKNIIETNNPKIEVIQLEWYPKG
ncbi:MAG TPA: MBL fold metallo-hydrolase [Flavobacteriaceae bacterium]|nr:MBL fold metallo-hydrolase [Flavobacteriaceae bacterium]